MFFQTVHEGVKKFAAKMRSRNVAILVIAYSDETGELGVSISMDNRIESPREAMETVIDMLRAEVKKVSPK